MIFLACLRPLAGADRPTLLAIFAHPDDEQTVSPLLARYARAGHPVYLAIITSGQKGATPHAGIPAGDQLGAAREQEARCACKQLGIREPLLLGFQDQGISTPPATDQVVARLREIMNQVKPAVIITWGPDGFTGHPDHRAASNLVTEAFQQRAALGHRPRKLYYFAAPESQFLKPPPPFDRRPARTVGDAFITTDVDTRAELEAARKSLECHKTQYRPEQIPVMHDLQAKTAEGRVFLRLALSDLPRPKARERDIFEGLK
jgi:LmbE family N-acetylglucosaminyl deacetylase